MLPQPTVAELRHLPFVVWKFMSPIVLSAGRMLLLIAGAAARAGAGVCWQLVPSALQTLPPFGETPGRKSQRHSWHSNRDTQDAKYFPRMPQMALSGGALWG